ncbi:mannose-6-phosphate isomerase isoform X2 [Prorops nasuta]|uniref:mannose-6-phosphate isomerase isoform X2 n=1 Tax=Prorops nasuta TaxID=863751 RepID=UPI0034CE22CE
MELLCKMQMYDWGKTGADSMVAALVKSANPEIIIDEKLSYAELWMGTHPNGPSYLKDENLNLQDYIEKNKSVAHPNKEMAKNLCEMYPDIYKDSNHKPELAIALTPFEALCGFRPFTEIKTYVKFLPELCAVIGEERVSQLASTNELESRNTLKECFHSLMTCDSAIVKFQLETLIRRLYNSNESSRQYFHADLLDRLYSDYPGDVGCFSIYLLNYFTMQPGEAIYLGPNVPHAYLSGDCVECMACSDNVVRAGLTPKLKDVQTLIKMLDYSCEPASAKRFQASREDDCTEIFRPPVSDFAVAKITIPPGRSVYNLIPRKAASILIIIDGKASIAPLKILNRGSALFIPANEEIRINVLCGCHPMLMFQAFTNV